MDENSADLVIILALIIIAFACIQVANTKNKQMIDKNREFLIDMLDNDSNNITVLNKEGQILFLNQQMERWVMKYSN
jgi:hypothetical protein